jgi:putative DNA primase/helicase
MLSVFALTWNAFRKRRRRAGSRECSGWKSEDVAMDDGSDKFAPLTPDELVVAPGDGTRAPDEGELASPVPANAPPSPTRHFAHGEPTATWIYRDANGAELCRILRFDFPDKRKQFCPLTLWREPTRLRWRWKGLPAPRPLYGLENLPDNPGAPIVVCEGEKAADAAAKVLLDHVAVTSSGGSQAAAKTDWTPAAGRRVLIWPDNDDPGQKYAREVAAILAALGCEVSIVDAAAMVTIDPGGRGPDFEPIGWDATNALAEWPDTGALRKTVVTLAKPFDAGPRYVSHGAFAMAADGLEIEMMRGSGNARAMVREPVSGPFEILGKSRSPNGSDWGLWLRWRDGDGRVHQRLVSSAALHGDPAALCQSLASEGLHIERKKQRELADYLNGADVLARVTRVERTGWHSIGVRDVFVLPGESIGCSAAETVILEGAANAPYETHGSLAEWRAGVGELASGHILPVLAISAAFAGPLLYLAGAEGGGVHFFGQSSKGKTTILQAAASVWGRGASPGYVKAWRATANGLEGAAVLATDTALVLDELGVLDARDAAAAIYALANGGGKQRAARDGSAREPKSWRVTFISSGENPFEAKLTEGKGKARAGQLLRLLDVPADRGRGFGVFDNGGRDDDAGALARAINRAASKAYGTAGPEFVRRILAESVTGDDVREKVSNFVKAECPPRADGQVERVAHRLGLIAVAGELATLLGLTGWREGEAREAAAWAFKAWLSYRGGADPAEARQAVEQVRLFIQQYGDSRCDPLDHPDAKPSPNRAGWRKGEGEEREWFIPPETWKFEICAGLDAVLVARTLAERGFIRRIGDGFQSPRKIDGSNKRVYVVTARIFAGADDDA